MDRVKRAFSTGTASLYDIDVDGYSVLHQAVNSCFYVICETLAQLGASPLVKDYRGMSAAHAAFQIATFDTEDEFSTACSTWIFSTFDESLGFTRFHKIVCHLGPGSLDEQLQLDDADVDVQDIYGRTALD